MKALEFTTRVKKKGIAIPEEVKQHLGSLEEREVKVIVLYEEEGKEENALKRYSLERFLEGYAEEDKVYDEL